MNPWPWSGLLLTASVACLACLFGPSPPLLNELAGRDIDGLPYYLLIHTPQPHHSGHCAGDSEGQSLGWSRYQEFEGEGEEEGRGRGGGEKGLVYILQNRIYLFRFQWVSLLLNGLCFVNDKLKDIEYLSVGHYSYKGGEVNGNE